MNANLTALIKTPLARSGAMIDCRDSAPRIVTRILFSPMGSKRKSHARSTCDIAQKKKVLSFVAFALKYHIVPWQDSVKSKRSRTERRLDFGSPDSYPT